MFLIFIEIIEINIFNISYNTKKNIELRSRIDSLIDFNSLLNINEEIEAEEMEIIKNLIDENNEKKDNRKDTKVKVYSNFLKDIILDMGFTIDDDYDYMVVPDYLDIEANNEDCIVIPSHKNVSKSIVERVKNRYDLLERKLCMKQ